MPQREGGSRRGQMVPKGDKKWLLRIYLGRDGAGKRNYSSKTFDGTTAQARQELTKMLRELDTETFVKPSKRTVKDYLSSWLDQKANLEVKTKLDYALRLNKDVYPFIGGLQLSQLSPEHLRILYGKLTSERKLSPRTVRYTHTVLTQALSVAVEDGLLNRNPCDRKSVRDALPKQVKTPPTILTPEQVVQVIDGEPDTQLQALWRLLLLSALRPQEALVLKWDDLSTDGMLSLHRTISEKEKCKETVKDYGKTESSMRTIALDDLTVAMLQRHRAAQAASIMKAGAAYTRNGYIFTTKTGAFMTRQLARRAWARALKRQGIPYVKLYVTRHTHISHLVEAGENIKAVAERAGHADPAMTLRVYTHTAAGSSRKLAGAAANLLTLVKEA